MLENKKVYILLSTYNGEKYIRKQVESLLMQNYKNLFVDIRDDGSEDATIQYLHELKNECCSNVTIHIEKNIGYKRSFLELLYSAPEADIYMFCDQDDVWEKDKVQAAVEKLKGLETPAIYTSNVRYCDEKLQVIGDSNFYNNEQIWRALLYNQAVGCTIAMNNELRKQIMRVPIENINFDNMYSHDCWVYRICAAIGGRCIFDSTPHILYRQHENNQIGGSASFLGTWRNRLDKINNRHIKQKLALELEKCYWDLISDSATKDAIYQIAHYKSFKSKLHIIKNEEIYTDNFIDNLGVAAAILLGVV